MNKKLNISILVTLLCTIISCTTSTKKNKPSKPNIIIILADDAGYSDFGFMGSKDIKTPNLDLLANDGVIFTDAHVSATVCSPSRAGLLTGRYQQRFGHECNIGGGETNAFDPSETTIAEALKTQGYKTSIFGKWHLGEKEFNHPLKNGFDYFWGFLAGGRSYFPNELQDQPKNSRAILENYQHTTFIGYLTDVIGNKAVEFIKDSTNNNQPFFMYLSFNAPHTPMHAKPELVDALGKDHKRPVYASMLWSMDEAIGNVINELKRKNIYNNTLIFFLSDNGGAHNNNSSVEPFKGWKGNQYEGGSRVPFILTWKNKVKGNRKFDGLTSSLDIFKTSIAAAGLGKNPGKTLDGVDLLPFLQNDFKKSPHQKLFWRKDQMATIRFKNYKLINLKNKQSVVYNLGNDIKETNDLYNKNIEITDSLKGYLNKWQSELSNPNWIEDKVWNEVTEIIYLDLMNNNETNIKDPGDLKRYKKIKEEINNQMH